MFDRLTEIISVADKLVEKYNTRNPFILARELNIEVVERNFKQQNGAYNVVLNNDFVFIRQGLCDEMKTIVLAHEIGHCMLHRAEAVLSGGFKDYNVFSKQNIFMEKEANTFAAQLLITDKEMFELFDLGYNISQMASYLNTDENLVAVKTDILSAKGYYVNKTEHKNDFLKKADA